MCEEVMDGESFESGSDGLSTCRAFTGIRRWISCLHTALRGCFSQQVVIAISQSSFISTTRNERRQKRQQPTGYSHSSSEEAWESSRLWLRHSMRPR